MTHLDILLGLHLIVLNYLLIHLRRAELVHLISNLCIPHRVPLHIECIRLQSQTVRSILSLTKLLSLALPSHVSIDFRLWYACQVSLTLGSDHLVSHGALAGGWLYILHLKQ